MTQKMTNDITKAIWSNLDKLKGSDPKRFNEVLNQFKVFDNPNREEIYNLVVKKGPLSIMDIKNITGLAYKNVHAHVKKLAEYEYVKTEKLEKSYGRKVMVSIPDKMNIKL